MTRRQFALLVIPLLAVLCGFTAVELLDRSARGEGPYWDAEFAEEVRYIFGRDFVGGPGQERLQQEAYFRALNAWLKTYDAMAEVVPPWQFEERQIHSTGEYGGVGIRIEQGAGALVESLKITGVKPGGPAAGAGVNVGDSIVGVDGHAFPAPMAQVQRWIRGKPGSDVSLRLRGPDGAERIATMEREIVEHESVLGVRMVDPAAKIGYLRIARFQLHTGAEFRAALKDLLDRGARALVVDVRDNPGGLLEQTLDVSDALLDEGVIARVRSREGVEVYHAAPDDTLAADLPLAVLVDRNSASASELFAGAVQDHRRGVLVGERTWGKFSVQAVREATTAAGPVMVKVTNALYETPNGRSRHRLGIDGQDDPLAGLSPDLHVPMSSAERSGVYRLFLEEELAAWRPGEDADRSGVRDPVLDAALAVLRGETHYPRLIADS